MPIRSIVGASGAHDAFECLTGRRNNSQQPPGGWPASARCSSKLEGAADPAMPPVRRPLAEDGAHALGRCRTAGFLGVAHAPFKPDGEGKGDMVLNGVTLDRLGDRKALLASFDRFRREADASGMMDGLDNFNQQAFGVLTSSRLMEALDIEKEDPKIRERYGKGDPEESRRRRPEADGALPRWRGGWSRPARAA